MEHYKEHLNRADMKPNKCYEMAKIFKKPIIHMNIGQASAQR